MTNNLYDYMRASIEAATQNATGLPGAVEKNILEKISVEQPANISFGDFATNAAMITAKHFKLNPKNIVSSIQENLLCDKAIKDVKIAGPGFINIDLQNEVWDSFLNNVVKSGAEFGQSEIGKDQKINLEFLSANPTGPMHIGHSRGAIYGDALARVLTTAGYDVTKEYYINDYGNQVDVLAASVYYRYEQLQGHHQEDMPKGMYPGDYIIPVAQDILNQDGDRWLNAQSEEWKEHFKDKAIAAMMNIIRSNLALLDISFDVFSSERALAESGAIEDAIEQLSKKNLVYKGVLPKPEGKDDEWHSEEQILFKSKQFGDTVDRVLIRHDGRTTYFASDIAYHKNKYDRGYSKQINIWGADHSGYIDRMKSAVSGVTDGNADLDVKLCQMVNLEKDGKPYKMSKRSGNFVMLSDLLEEIDSDAFRFYMLTRASDTPISFDLSKVKEQSKDNVVYYIQYAHSRTHSVLEKFKNTFGEEFDTKNVDIQGAQYYQNASDKEKEIVKQLARYPEVAKMAATEKAPHLIVNFMNNLAGNFHSLWSGGNNDQIRLVDENDYEGSKLKMFLATAVQTTLANGMKTLGVNPKNRMI